MVIKPYYTLIYYIIYIKISKIDIIIFSFYTVKILIYIVLVLNIKNFFLNYFLRLI